MKTNRKLMFLKSDNLKSIHAFSTRLGGVSTNPYTRELNLAFDRGDSDETVIENLKIFAENVGFDPQRVVSLPQIHSDIIYKVDSADVGQGYFKREGLREGDGYVTNSHGVVLGVKSADCTPILFEARCSDAVIAVGAVHAGWRGTVARIAEKCVNSLCDNYGAEKSEIFVAIGPCIRKCCFEVGEDFVCEYKRHLGELMTNEFVLPSNVEGKYFCDLVGTNKNILRDCGIPSENINVVDRCTCCEHDLFFSHRYSKGHRGTMLSVITM